MGLDVANSYKWWEEADETAWGVICMLCVLLAMTMACLFDLDLAHSRGSSDSSDSNKQLAEEAVAGTGVALRAPSYRVQVLIDSTIACNAQPIIHGTIHGTDHTCISMCT